MIDVVIAHKERIVKATNEIVEELSGLQESNRLGKETSHACMLGHKSVETTLIYIQLEDALFQQSDEWTVKVAENIDKATKLLEAGFEYVMDMNDKKLFRKRK